MILVCVYDCSSFVRAATEAAGSPQWQEAEAGTVDGQVVTSQTDEDHTVMM